ncbi:MFS transporter [Massilia sp. IC2-278]|uniref:MFS transporter n=1 Tax=Massilia sp. IC2-278 TaxID=2887200 RepID=UPI001E2BE5A6|nr:MFS transporter [Massilia sp. IC2-278]MCC2960226.1 MFS transporter [Massilia sp. IC2-278]
MSERDPNPGALWRNTNFRWLFGGGVISLLGDQFTLIALPWLVLKLSGDPLALGGVLAAIGAPRAIFMLVGGAIVDRSSPRRILLLTKYANAVLIGLLGALVLTQRVDMALVYVLAAAIGVCSAFAYPAGSALLPGVLEPALLAPANGILMGMRQVAMLLGPLLAGVVIAAGGDAGDAGGGIADARGLGIALLLDALSYLLSAATLARVRPLAQTPPAANKPPLLASLKAGLRYCWDDTTLRACFLYWSAMALFVSGPLQIAMPLLAERLGGAGTYGSLMAAHGAGMLAGMLLSNVRPGLRIANFGTTLLVADGVVGLLFIAMAGVAGVWQGVGLLVALGVVGGYLQVAVMSWLQRRISLDMLGRAMALLMFLFMGLAPLSAALSGWLVGVVGLGAIFAGAGVAMLVVVVCGYVGTPIRHLSET